MTTLAPSAIAPSATPVVKALTKAELADAHLRITQAKASVVLKHPFFATLLLQRPLIVSESVPTAGADAKGRIYVNPRFVLSKEVREVGKVVFLLCHEMLHIYFLHCQPQTLMGRKQGAANVAMDKVINETLIASGIGDFIQGGQRHSGAQNMKWQDLYDENDDDGPGGIGEDLIPCPDGEPGEAEAGEIAEQLKVELSAAAQIAKKQGKLPAALEKLVDELLYVRTPWHSILERFMTAFVQADYSWKRPNRRFTYQGIYLPSLDRVPRMGKIVIAFDESGSVSDKEFQYFLGHLNRIIETCMPEEVILLHADTTVHKEERFTPDEYPIPFKRYCFGGTDMREVWQYVQDNGIEADCLVLMTDGETPWPESVDIPSLIVSTTDQVAPDHVGETIKFEIQ